MKKLFLTLCIAFTAMQLWAGDLIVSTKSERIDAVIQEVSETEVRYKKANNPNGPTFVMKTGEVATIIYANGEVQAFEHAEQPQQVQPVQQAPLQSMVIAPVVGPQVQQGILGQVTKDGDMYYYNGQTMTRDTYLQFASQNCPAAYDAYKSGRKMLRAGGALFGVGVPVLAVGITLYVIGFPGNGKADGYPELWIPGALFIGLGSGMVTASIPLMAVGNYRKRHSHDIFNEKCASPRAAADRLYLDFNAGPASAGVALRF